MADAGYGAVMNASAAAKKEGFAKLVHALHTPFDQSASPWMQNPGAPLYNALYPTFYNLFVGNLAGAGNPYLIESKAQLDAVLKKKIDM